MDITLREFAYIDKQIVVDFLSSIQASLPIERRQAVAKKGKKLGGRVGLLFAQVEGEKGSVETETEEKSAVGDAGLFQMLYAKLDEQCFILRKISESISSKSILEVEGRIMLPALEMTLDVLCDQLAPFWETIRTVNPRGWATINMIAKLRASSPLNLRIIPSASQCEESMKNVNIVASLRRGMLRKPLPELADDYSVLCRVTRVLKAKESYDLFKLPMKLDDEKIDSLLESFRNMPPESKTILGGDITREDIQVGYPAIIVTPIAIYR